jgi:hypothetical protein
MAKFPCNTFTKFIHFGVELKVKNKLVSAVFVGAVMITSAVSAATSSTTLRNSQSSATGSFIYQGSGSLTN